MDSWKLGAWVNGEFNNLISVYLFYNNLSSAKEKKGKEKCEEKEK